MDNVSGIADAIRKATEAYTEALGTVTKALQNLASQRGGADRERVVENWLRLARMSKDGAVSALEHGFELWERECRRMAAAPGGAAAQETSDPMAAWAENCRKPTEPFTAPTPRLNEEARKQAETVHK